MAFAIILTSGTADGPLNQLHVNRRMLQPLYLYLFVVHPKTLPVIPQTHTLFRFRFVISLQ